MANAADATLDHSHGPERANATARQSQVRTVGLEDQLSHLQDKLASITKTVTRLGEARVTEVRHHAADEIKHFVKSGRHVIDGVHDELGHVEKQIVGTIRERPLAAIAGAIALGFIVAILTR